jgi:hypothetical protein
VGDLIPAGRELPRGHGFINKLYLTPSGNIGLGETKLWRNNQCAAKWWRRRSTVSALSAMSYEAPVARGRGPQITLYDLLSEHPETLEEAE